MPNNQHTDDAELSALLKQAEPPESPDELDETILQYARDNAPNSTAYSSSSSSLAWLTGRPWVSAVATFSIAMIAISVTLQNFDNEVREQAVSFSESDLGLSSSDENIAIAARAPGAEPVALEAEQLERARQSLADSDQPVDGIALAESVAVDVQTLEEEIDDQLLTVENTAIPAPASQTRAVELSQSPVDSLATSAGSSAARRSTNEAVSVQADAATISESNLVASENFPEFLNFMEGLLDDDVENDREIERRESPLDNSLSQRAQALLQNYEQLLQSDSAEPLRSRYGEAASTYTSFDLPPSLEQALEVLRLTQ